MFGQTFEIQAPVSDERQRVVAENKIIVAGRRGFVPDNFDRCKAVLDAMKPEQMAGSPWHEEYLRTAPRPDDFPRLFGKVRELNRNIPDTLRTMAGRLQRQRSLTRA